MSEEYIDTGRREQKLKTRDRIIKNAQKFLNKGQDFTLEDVAKQAGLSRATVYRYYSSVEVLATEAGIDLNIDSPEVIFESLKDLPIEEIILGIQDYFNRFTLENEPAFRKFLSVVIPTESPESKRGARRNRTLQIAFKDNDLDIDKADIENLINIAPVLMGMEPIIVTKDVCRLDDQESLELLQWGLKMILQGMLNPK